jgi:hypothetical protein
VLVDADGADYKVDVWVCGEVFRGTVSFGGSWQAMGLDGGLGALDAGVAQSDYLVFGGGFEVGEVGEDSPRHGRGETDEAYAEGCHCGGSASLEMRMGEMEKTIGEMEERIEKGVEM